MENRSVNVEEIMKEIQKKSKAVHIDECIKFENSVAEKQNDIFINKQNEFNMEKFNQELKRANENCVVDFVMECPKGNLIATFIRTLVMKLTRFYFKLVVEKQNQYNEYIVRTLNELGAYIRDSERLLNKQNEVNIKLDSDIRELIVRINEENIKKVEALELQNIYLKMELEVLKGKSDS